MFGMTKVSALSVDQLKTQGFKYQVGSYVFKSLNAASDYSTKSKTKIVTLTHTNALRGL